MRKFIFALVALGISASTQAKEYVIKLKDIHNHSIQLLNGLTVLDSHSTGGLIKVDLDEDQSSELMTVLFSQQNVEYIVENFRLALPEQPSDMSPSNLRRQWSIEMVRAQEAWDLANIKGDRQVTVAVIDTGVDYNHESLSPNMVPGYDFLENDNDPMDATGAQNPGHGTHCAGAVGATGLVSGGIIGLSPQVSLMPIRFLGADGGGDLMNGIKSIDYAIEKGVDIISASWGARVPRSQALPLIEAVERADKAGVIFVSAAANDGRDNDTNDYFPTNAKFSSTISVAASTASDQKPSWSNFGRANVDVAAPGENIVSTLPRNRYGDLSGTSMATPLVAGLVALLKAVDPQLTGPQIKALIQATGAAAPITTACNCRVDAFAAVSMIKEAKPWVVPSAGTIGQGEAVQFSVANGLAPFTYKVDNSAVAEINEEGVLTAKANGEFKVEVTDASGKTASTLAMFVGRAPSSNPPGGGGECPLGDPALCDLLCLINPSLPFCG